MKKINLILALFFYSLNVMSQPTLAGKKILVVYGGWEGHKPEFFAKKIVSWLEEREAKVTLSKTTSSYTCYGF